MNVLLVSFEQPSTALAQIGPVETRYVQFIQSQQTWARVMANVYLVVTPLTAEQMRNQLNVIQSRKLLVYNVTNSLWAANALPPDVSQWLQSNWRQT